MVRKKTARAKKKSVKPFRFELGWSGLAGITVTVLCILVWMFMLGVWAGQTILLPQSGSSLTASLVRDQETEMKVIKPEGKKVPAAGKDR